ncbi:hypothetical protein OLZ32_09305 [Rhizobium sp. 1AS11]|uniref:SAF domain-containing protein n=1 Tax=Rhizobium acaciae TaxID=2989736 RepID=UPI0022239B08|nr:SAF domain-containing protein [Rhizobium acaciae]MCW1408789.1 hypothetical protein [Rhizobium acaciae]MCW1740611.1 hypothetical protein [Rhizobium acaciae]
MAITSVCHSAPAASAEIDGAAQLLQRKPVRKGEMFTNVNLRSIRPGFGMKAKRFDALLGRRAARDIAFVKSLDASMIEGGFEA